MNRVAMLSICIWKEWREHRATFLWLLAIALSVQILLVLLLPEFWVGPQFLQYSVLVWTTIAMLLFSTSLVQSEYRREEEAFALRLPLAERHRFYAKILIAALLILGTLAMSGAHLSLLIWMRDIDAGSGLLPSLRWLPLLMSTALLLMGVAWWLPRSALVVPLFLLLLGIATLPALLAFGKNYWVRPDGPDLILFLGILLPLLSFTVARVSSRGRCTSTLRSFLMGGGVFFGGFLSLSALGASKIDAWDRFDPLEKDLQFYEVFIGKGSKLAFVNASQKDAPRFYPLVVDLQTGNYEQAGTAFTRFALPRAGANIGIQGQAGEHGVLVEIQRPENRRNHGPESRRYLDGRDGRLLFTGNRHSAPDSLVSMMRQSVRDSTPYRAAEGSRVWFFDGLERGDVANPERLQLPSGIWPLSPRGCGGTMMSQRKGPWSYYDIHRGRSYDLSIVPEQATPLSGSGRKVEPKKVLRAITPAGWILLQSLRASNLSHSSVASLWDPDSGKERELTGISLDSKILTPATLPDGRLLLLEPREKGVGHELVLFDPRTDSGVALMAEEVPRVFQKSKSRLNREFPLWTPAGRILFRVNELVDGERMFWLMSLDPKSLAVEQISLPRHRKTRVLACPDESQVLLQIDNTIQRYRWGKKGGELLFPRPGTSRVPTVRSAGMDGGQDR